MAGKRVPLMHRQGDVLLMKIGKLPAGAQQVASDQGRVILAYGEATGHAHAINARFAQMYRWEGDFLVEVSPGATLVHEEHAAIPLAPGVYRVLRQREFTPTSVRFVAD